jgi:hypothetical protein
MLLVSFNLPTANEKGTKDILDLLADFNLGSVTDQFGRSTMLMDVVFKSVNKLLVRLHAINISEEGLSTNKDLSTGGSIINSWNISIDSISGHRFITAMHIECWLG